MGEKIQKFQNDARQSNLKSKLAENEVRKYSREVEELQHCKIQLEKFETMIETLSIENLELHKTLSSLRRTLVNERKERRESEDSRTGSGALVTKDSDDVTNLTVTHRGAPLREEESEPAEQSIKAQSQQRPSLEDYLL